MLSVTISGRVVGFAWGFRMLQKEFPFLKGKVPDNSGYLDTLVVSPRFRKRGIGRDLVDAYIKKANGKYGLVVTRTDDRSVAAMALFRSAGFRRFSPPMYDPVLAHRIYLKKSIQKQSKTNKPPRTS